MSTVSIGAVPVGDGHPAVFMAEIGTFFNQDVDLGCAYLEAAVAAGVKVLKSEILHDPEVCLRSAPLDTRYNTAQGQKVERYRALIERKVVPLDGYRKMIRKTVELGVPFVASVYDFAGVDLMAECGGAAIKIARHNIDHLPLIAYSAQTGLPVIFDAGLVYLDEIALAVRTARQNGRGGVIINHHPGANPAGPELQNLRMIATYKAAFGCPAGLTCHYRGGDMLAPAVTAGANLVEKGVVDDPDRAEQDLVSAVRLSELPAILRRFNDASVALGSGTFQPSEPRDLSTRKGLVAARDLPAGEPLAPGNVRFAWPPLGIPVVRWAEVNGKPAARFIPEGQPIGWSDIDFR